MTLYQKINSMRTKYGDFTDENQIPAQQELEDNIYDLLVYSMKYGKNIKVNDQSIDDFRISLTSTELYIPYGKSDIVITIASGRLTPNNNGIVVSDKCLYINAYTYTYGGYEVKKKIARTVMNNLYKRICDNVELHAYLILQGINIEEILLINLPYEDPIEVNRTPRGTGMFIIC
jgi:hypothetical protein